MTVAIPIFLANDKKLWVIDEIHNPHDNVGKANNNEKCFTSKWSEIDSLNTKGNVKQKWGKQKRNKALLKTSLRFSLTCKRRIKLAIIFAERPKWQIQNHIKTCKNSYHIEASQLIYIANQFTVWAMFLLKCFWSRLSRLLSLVVEKISWMYRMATDWANFTTSFWQYHFTG